MRAKRQIAAAAFVALLALSVWWPSPIVSVNRLCCHADLGVDELSFLGREEPRWDVAFWCLAGLFAIGLFQSGEWEWREFAEPWRFRSRGFRAIMPLRLTGLAAVGVAAVAMTWHFLDAPITAWAERIQSDTLEEAIRITNRLGGGLNPALIVLFFLIAGVVYRHRPWSLYGVQMALAGAAAGLSIQIVKYAAGRTRPELWLGPFHHTRISATSFPSGHTVGAFALAGVLLLTSPSKTLRAVAFVLATAVGLARILAFRHWTSDVLASAIIGMLLAWIVTRITNASAPVV
jgi:membrane-associated phospholipid phosphatase